MMRQTFLMQKKPIKKHYESKQLNIIQKTLQKIELSRGCLNNCPFCNVPTYFKTFPIPEIVRNNVQILDDAFLTRKDALNIIRDLGKIKLNGRCVRYEMLRGFEYRRMTQEIANKIRGAHFIKPRIAWDMAFTQQLLMKKAIYYLKKAGYAGRSIRVFMLVNWKIPYAECLKKLDLMKIWGVQVNDCCFDGGYKYTIPENWTTKEIKAIRKKCRKHNQMIIHGLDPEALRGWEK